ncbi:MAG: NYN domain-containing protein [Bryobacteraceae bacterium]|nr:NYN domain-containing protein [Bryobacteraceae bacterium]MCX7604988.1 NYN domain-containing protein [Bryobacteraceae bacterium]
MFKAAVLVDGGYLRAVATKAQYLYTPDFIERLAFSCFDPREEILYRIFYYDCPPFHGDLMQPVSQQRISLRGSAQWLVDLSRREYFAVRLGIVKFRGFALKRLPPPSDRPLEDSDFRPVFEQKGVDMRMGIDIASLCEKRLVDRLILLSGDTDIVPAMKHARKSGLQVVLALLPDERLTGDLFTHTDLRRHIAWPEGAQRLAGYVPEDIPMDEPSEA